MTIVEFLLARIAEDEAELGVLASGVHDDSAGPNGLGWGDVGGIGSVLIVSHGRAKAECEAKRRIIGLHPEILTICQECANESWPCRTVMTLVLPYADHPDFDPAWRS